MEQENQLSNLPKIILHHILSRLPEEDAARTSVLSKAWAETWSTFPILSFSETKIIGRKRKNFNESEDYLRKREQFLDYVERTLLRFRDQGLAIKQFKLSVNYFDLHCLSKDVDRWLKLATESGVEVLELYQPPDDRDCYILPTSVLEAKSLTKLVLMGRIGVNLAFMNRSMKFFLLQVLSLLYVVLGDEQTFQHLISHCPFIEYITLVSCFVYPGGQGGLNDLWNSPIKSLSMCGLPRLKGVRVQGIQEVYVDSLCLDNLYYCPSSPEAPFKMDFNRCRNLRGLSLHSLRSTIISNKWFLELFAKLPFLESLKLDSCAMSERVNISSVQLKVLELSYCFNLKEINIDAPNLLSCLYCGNSAFKPITSFPGCSSKLVVNVWMHFDYLNLCNLREFIENLKPQTVLKSVSLIIKRPIADALNPAILQVSSPPPSIGHLVLHCVPPNEALYFPLVYRLLSSCCPATISIRLHSRLCCSREFIEVFYETLMGRNEDKCFCSSNHTKCWWHGLKGVKVTSSMSTDENADFKTMLDTLPTSPATVENIISFSRNMKLWEDIQFSTEAAIGRANEALENWRHFSNNNDSAAKSANRAGDVKWVKPRNNDLKCNIDAAIFKDQSCYGVGMCRRNDEGKFMQAKTMWFQGIPLVHEAEVVGLHQAILWLTGMGVTKVTIEMDCKMVVDELKGPSSHRTEFGNNILRCNELLRVNQNYEVSFIKRQANIVAHSLARAAIFYASHQLFENAPICIENLILNERV